MLKAHPWAAIKVYQALGVVTKQETTIPEYVPSMADGTSAYEAEIRRLWIEFKADPSEANARAFIDKLKEYSGTLWPETAAAIFGIDFDQLTEEQLAFIEDELGTHHAYMEDSLLPDIIKAAAAGTLDSMDYRTTFLYAGALWMFGGLATVMFDGLSLRDLGDLFLFAGPKDDDTCTGERGCHQLVGNVYTVAEILANNYGPGRMRCMTNCRHFWMPIASPLDIFKHLPGKHDQRTHTPHKYRGRGVEIHHSLGGAQVAMDNLNLTEDALEQMFWMPGAARTKVVATSLSGNRVMEVAVEWYDADGDELAYAERRFYRDDKGRLVVNNRKLEIHQQNTGAGSVLYANQIRELKNRGYHSIHLEANSSIGRYAWARKGFDFVEEEGYKQKRLELDNQRFREWAGDRGMTEQRLGGWPTFTSASDIANYDPGPGVSGSSIENWDVSDDVDLHLGKAYMLDWRPGGFQSWYGELTLDE